MDHHYLGVIIRANKKKMVSDMKSHYEMLVKASEIEANASKMTAETAAREHTMQQQAWCAERQALCGDIETLRAELERIGRRRSI